MKNWMLISCCERDFAFPEFFESKEEAKKEMIRQVADYIGFTTEEVANICSNGPSLVGNDSACIGDDYAWSDHHETCDWRIFNITEDVESVPIGWLRTKKEKADKDVYYCKGDAKENVEISYIISLIIKMWYDEQLKQEEEAEHPEPVYPTWGEWLESIEVIKYNDRADSVNYLIRPTHKTNTRIPADIAEKLGIEPKEG